MSIEALVFDVDGVCRILCLRPRARDDRSDGDADAVHRPAREHGVGRDLHVRQQLRRRKIQLLTKITAGHDSFDARHRFRVAYIDGNDFRMRIRTPLEGQMQHAWKINIVDVAASAGHKRRIFHSLGRSADQPICCVFDCHEFPLKKRDWVRGSCSWIEITALISQNASRSRARSYLAALSTAASIALRAYTVAMCRL